MEMPWHAAWRPMRQPSASPRRDTLCGKPGPVERRLAPMPRLFTAIEIPEQTRLRLSLLRAPIGGAKWVQAEDMHITLRFAGDIDGRTADDFTNLLAETHVQPFTVSISGGGAFGGRD